MVGIVDCLEPSWCDVACATSALKYRAVTLDLNAQIHFSNIFLYKKESIMMGVKSTRFLLSELFWAVLFSVDTLRLSSLPYTSLLVWQRALQWAAIDSVRFSTGGWCGAHRNFVQALYASVWASFYCERRLF